ncbi:MFS transporter [Actinosynnema mirum]|uniref:Major facilitator superfamily MFS_1 n=1 Tax=Actinosynnema mirum (strain ATCC 29888 / DSM 43827 / JCM 3225 / NBRC 14064 / NCIMB 13271 / NRRL B-12336 / IMRU 3971 / 101) TaxID=446462 RepID=C6WQ19_ACTMD|nr:MFS transporter [Actinosynnema mirum]ACU35075.1 major facilitator superfamily MFS_1 [Actinosynnema mirum DSM 43827]
MPTQRFAVFAAFALNGIVFGSWAARVPALADRIGATEGSLGLALLGGSIGLAATAPLAARLCVAVGARAVLLASALLGALVLPAIGLVGSPLQLGAVLLVVGALNAALDVSMNLSAVTVIRATGRALMPRFHAGFSVGGLIGSLGAAAAASADWTPLRHFLVATAACLLLLAWIARAVPGAAPDRGARHDDSGGSPLRRPVLWLLAAVALCSAIAEGASADWSALFLVTERGVGDGAAAIAYAAFSTAMAAARLLGEPVQRRLGPHRLLQLGALVAASGLALAVLVPLPAAGFGGFALAGLGLAFAFPVVMDLAGEAGRRADGGGGEREIGLVTTIAYTGFLAGPPLVGGIAQASSLTTSLGLVAVVVALTAPLALLARRARDREVTRGEASPTRS